MNVEGLGLISKKLLTSIADAIRKKGGGSSEMTPTEMPEAIKGISSGNVKFSQPRVIRKKETPFSTCLIKDVAPERLVYASARVLADTNTSLSVSVKALVGKTLIAIVLHCSKSDGTENPYTVTEGWTKIFDGASPKSYSENSSEQGDAQEQFLAVFYKTAEAEEETITFTAETSAVCALGVVALHNTTTPSVALAEGGTQANKLIFGDDGGAAIIAWHTRYASVSNTISACPPAVIVPKISSEVQRFAVAITGVGRALIRNSGSRSNGCAAITIRI